MDELKSNWTSLHIYVGESQDTLLKECLPNLIQRLSALGHCKKYFFIRYNDKGPHLRLRILSEFNDKQEVLKDVIENELRCYLTDKNLENSCSSGESLQWIDYEPEVFRYGGPRCLEVSETLFEASSHLTINLIKNVEKWDGNFALHHAMISNIIMMAFFLGTDTHLSNFFKYYHQCWISRAIEITNRTSTITDVKIQYEKLFQSNKAQLQKTIEFTLNSIRSSTLPAYYADWMDRIKSIVAQLRVLAQRHEILMENNTAGISDSWYLGLSYVHMNNNRLGVKFWNESLAAYLIYRALEEVNAGK